MSKPKGPPPRIKIGNLKKSLTKLNKTEQIKVKDGVLADGSVRVFGDGSVRSIKAAHRTLKWPRASSPTI
ncbi:MAG: hypothetical protein AABM67_15835 [Acidobacteriota bacterium]